MQCTSHQYCRYLHTDYFKYSPKTLKWDIIWSNNTKSPSKRVVSPLICLRCVLVDYPPPGLGARPRDHSRDDKIPPRLLLATLATLATRPPPLCPLSSPLSANGNCYSQSITINRGPQGLETRACNETNLWVVSQSQKKDTTRSLSWLKALSHYIYSLQSLLYYDAKKASKRGK